MLTKARAAGNTLVTPLGLQVFIDNGDRLVFKDSLQAGHTFDCTPDPTSVFHPSSALRFGPGPACDSVPIRFYSRPVRNSLPHPAFNPDFATSHNSALDDAESKCLISKSILIYNV
ncbi:hypothetical protein EVAR_33869_1 [Eumeta japonica]|uniref:Uncharacterized protein n=1 Tax=Eumeta variegata TaxID=151549 RepID=A0A4C1X839_EUMVA|nr:hypothetical protein EVAR_33869_1 [Eumeta japonica]